MSDTIQVWLDTELDKEETKDSFDFDRSARPSSSSSDSSLKSSIRCRGRSTPPTSISDGVSDDDSKAEVVSGIAQRVALRGVRKSLGG